MTHKGWIALDIDGTITDHIDTVPIEVVAYLKGLAAQGWKLIFLTGRTFSFGQKALKNFDFPYFFAMQNGADILQMPERTLISRAYLKGDVISVLEGAYAGEKEDFLLYAGYEKGDFCYYRPLRFSPAYLVFLEKMKTLCPEPWKAVNSFNFDKEAAFPLIKCLGTREEMDRIHQLLSAIPHLYVTLIRDSIWKDLYLNLVTHPLATKGLALQRTIAAAGLRGPVIAAGDDLNDLTMLECADFSIAMETAPAQLLTKADLVAPSAAKLGIIAALKHATGLYD